MTGRIARTQCGSVAVIPFLRPPSPRSACLAEDFLPIPSFLYIMVNEAYY